MRVFVPEDREVVRAVRAWRIERAGNGLEQVLVGDARNTVLERDLIGVVTAPEARVATIDRTGLEITDLRIAFAARVRTRLAVAEVRLLHVPGLLSEAQEVREVVHPVVADKQVDDRRVDVVASRRSEVRRVALARIPLVREREVILPARGRRAVVFR